MSEGSGLPYKVVRSEATRQTLRQWAELAKQAGVHPDYAAALRAIEDRLQHDPIAWGDPLYQAQQLGLTIYRGLHRFLVVEYGVHEAKRIVFIKQYRLLPGNPLEPGA